MNQIGLKGNNIFIVKYIQDVGQTQEKQPGGELFMRAVVLGFRSKHYCWPLILNEHEETLKVLPPSQRRKAEQHAQILQGPTVEFKFVTLPRVQVQAEWAQF